LRLDPHPRLANAPRWVLLVLACAACRSSPGDDSSAQTSARCVSCHLPEYQAVTHPPHRDVKPTTCGTCHDESSWHPSRLVHSFPLTGAHAKADCFECHHRPTPVFEGTTELCVGCHAQDQQTANARVAHHETFPTQCETCHGTIAWKPTLPHQQPAPSTNEAKPLEPSVKEEVRSPAHLNSAKATVASVSPKPSKTPTPDTISGASRAKWKK
jgi:hypothetical protein